MTDGLHGLRCCRPLLDIDDALIFGCCGAARENREADDGDYFVFHGAFGIPQRVPANLA